MPHVPCPYNDQNWAHHRTSIPSEAGNFRDESTTNPHVLPQTSSRLHASHMHNCFRLSNSLSAPHHDESTLSATHPSYSFLPAGSDPLIDTSTDYRDMGFPLLTDAHSMLDSFHPHLQHNLPPNADYGVSPGTHYQSALDSTVYSSSLCQQFSWPPGNVQVNSVDEYPLAPSYHQPPVTQLHNSGTTSLPPPVDYTLEQYSGTLGTSYPCLWTEGSVTCHMLVPATRSHMNRHLHAHHGFGGPDTRLTKCNWAGCGETMQQGSIARHMVTCHLQTKVTCPMCSKKLSRQDVISKHQRVCPAASAWR